MGSCAGKKQTERCESQPVIVEKTEDEETSKIRKTKETGRKQDSMEQKNNLLGTNKNSLENEQDVPVKKISVLQKDSRVEIVDIPEDRADSYRNSSSNMTYMGNYQHVHIVRAPSYLENSERMSMFRSSTNMGKVMNSDLHLKESYPEDRPASKVTHTLPLQPIKE